MSSEHLVFADWEVSPRIVAFSTTRKGGVSLAPYSSLNTAMHVGDDPVHVQSNRSALASQFANELQWQWLNQVHGTDVPCIDTAGEEITADGLWTAQSKLVCCVQTADCLPVFFAANDGSQVGIVHAGWKGLVAGVIEKSFAEISMLPKDFAVWLGPAIGACHFEVGGEVRDQFLSAPESLGMADAIEQCFHQRAEEGKYMADLYALARCKLKRIGVENISGGGRCTFCEEEQFFSFRRDGPSGRMLNAIYLRD